MIKQGNWPALKRMCAALARLEFARRLGLLTPEPLNLNLGGTAGCGQVPRRGMARSRLQRVNPSRNQKSKGTPARRSDYAARLITQLLDVGLKMMADHSKTEGIEATWKPVRSSTKVSPGWRHGYAERLALRLQSMDLARYRNGGAVTLHPDFLELPKRRREPRRIFVNSMNNLFHDRAPPEFVCRVFASMADCPHHTFQLLTKPSQRLREPVPRCPGRPTCGRGDRGECQRAFPDRRSASRAGRGVLPLL